MSGFERGIYSIDDDDIVKLSSTGRGLYRAGWVNVGAHSLHILIDENGNLHVSAYPLGNEDVSLASMTVTYSSAMSAGATDQG